MAGKDLKYNLRFDAKDAKKALADTSDAADDTRTKAQKLADALGRLADDADAEFADTRSASEAMARRRSVRTSSRRRRTRAGRLTRSCRVCARWVCRLTTSVATPTNSLMR